jgi:hypothetical protein
MKLPILQAIMGRHYGLRKPDQRERGESIVSYSRCRTSNVEEMCNEVSDAGIMSMAKQSCTWNARNGTIGETMELLARCIMSGQMSI